VHRDIKPSNILVRPATRADGSTHFETRLMDFGLAKYYGVKTSLSAEAGFVGTVAYCAPEQINLDELDYRADLYCLGLVGYELLSGRYVFPEARLAGMRPLIQAHLNDKPRQLTEVNPEVPAPIADVVMKYLRKQPRRRPDSAGVLRSAIASYLGVDERSVVSCASLVELRPRLSVTGFVCRTREQEAIDDVLRRCLRPASGPDLEVPPSLVVVSGEPGIGKSSVVQEAERIARGHGCQVYEGRCFDGNLSPFQPFVEILRQLIAEMRLQERREAEAPADEDLTGTHVAGLPAQSLVRLLGDRQHLQRRAASRRARAAQIPAWRSLSAGRFRPRGRLHLSRLVCLLPGDRDASADLPEHRGLAMGGQELARPAPQPGGGDRRFQAIRIIRCSSSWPSVDDRRLGPDRVRPARVVDGATSRPPASPGHPSVPAG